MTTGYFAPATDVMWRMLDEAGIPAQSLFAEFGIDPELRNDPNARLPFSQVVALWDRVEQITGDPCIGLRSARHFQATHIGALGHAWLASTTLRNGLQRMARYSRLVNDYRSMAITDVDDKVCLTLSQDRSELSRVSRTDSILSCIDAMCRWRTGKAYGLELVELCRPTPSHAARYTEHYGCAVRFDAERDALHIAVASADAPLPGGDPQLGQINEQYLCKLVANLDRNDLSTQVKSAVLAELPAGAVRMGTVAERLHLSERTLQRRLNEQQTNFSALLEQTRRELALDLLRDRHRSLTDIAFSTGFSSLSSFSTAVRQWTGTNPSQLRQPV